MKMQKAMVKNMICVINGDAFCCTTRKQCKAMGIALRKTSIEVEVAGKIRPTWEYDWSRNWDNYYKIFSLIESCGRKLIAEHIVIMEG